MFIVLVVVFVGIGFALKLAFDLPAEHSTTPPIGSLIVRAVALVWIVMTIAFLTAFITLILYRSRRCSTSNSLTVAPRPQLKERRVFVVMGL